VNKLCLCVLLLSSSAQADFYEVYAQNNLNYWIQPQFPVTNYSKSSGDSKPSPSTPGPAKNADTVLAYVPSRAVSAQVTTSMLSDLARQSGTTLAGLRASIAAQKDQTLPPALIAQFLRKKGYPVNNIASSFNVFLAISYNTLVGAPLSSGRERAMYKRVQSMLAPGFAKVSDAQKQHSAEYFAWMAQLQFYQNRRNPQVARQAALAVLKEFGLDQARLEVLAAE
jgi:hypothetical protein